MEAFLTGLVELGVKIAPNRSQRMTHISIGQSMMMRPTCPCCSSTLLRHARHTEIYWRCSYCYQEMPA
jgi:ribosomal protein L37AE/L43A